jgi:hypothetical protein
VGCAIASGCGRPIAEAIDEVVEAAGAIRCEAPGDLRFTDIRSVVIAAWGPPAFDSARAWVAARIEGARIIDTAALGCTLAAGPALGWAAAIDLAMREPGGVLVIDLGVDGDAGAVVFRGSSVGAAVPGGAR